jgi:hypothetical protein
MAKLQDDVKAAFQGHNVLAVALSKIARGRPDNGRPLPAETSRQLARGVITSLGMDWGNVLKVEASMAEHQPPAPDK